MPLPRAVSLGLAMLFALFLGSRGIKTSSAFLQNSPPLRLIPHWGHEPNRGRHLFRYRAVRAHPTRSLPSFGDDVLIREQERVKVGRNEGTSGSEIEHDEAAGGREEDGVVVLRCVVATPRTLDDGDDEATSSPTTPTTTLPVALLLHGFPDSWYTWRFQIPALARAGYKVVCPDLRGYGLSSKPTRGGVAAFGAEAVVADVAELRRYYCRRGQEEEEEGGDDDEGAGSFALLCGHDWGAAVAWTAAAALPDVAEKVVVINVPHPTTFSSGLLRPSQLLKSWYIFAFQIPRLPERLLTSFDAAPVRGVLRKSDRLPGGVDGPDEEAIVAAAVTESRAMQCALHYYRAAAAGLWPAFVPDAAPTWALDWVLCVHNAFYPPLTTEVSDHAGNDGSPFIYRQIVRAMVKERSKGKRVAFPVVEAPVLVLWGEQDRFLSQFLASPPSESVPRLVTGSPVFLEASHFPHWDLSERVNNEILSFLQQGGEEEIVQPQWNT